MKVLSVFGTRPEAIKMVPLALALRSTEGIESRICVTSQHLEMLEQVMKLFQLQPDYNLAVMSPGQTLIDLTRKILHGLETVLNEFKPDLVLVRGDTTTTLAATLAAYYKQIDVGHVEAGLRTHNIYSPWPEEGNRKLTAAIAKWHFAPTATARDNLLAEDIADHSVLVTGNTVIDALYLLLKQIEQNPDMQRELRATFPFLTPARKVILVTAHRRESFGSGFDNICQALKTVVTDSGGIQEEAPSLGKPVLVMRDTTARPEAVEAGTVQLVGNTKR